MNTNIKIQSYTRASASSKNVYNLTRQKYQMRDIVVIEQNEMPAKKTLTSEQQKEYRKAQKDLSCYQKRLDEAIANNKEKSIATNTKNVEKAKAILSKYENRNDKREKQFVEFTVSLTNSQGEKYAEDWSQKTLDYFKNKYDEFEVISAVEHRDQHSPHLHILMYSKDKSAVQVIQEKEKDKYNQKIFDAKFEQFKNDFRAYIRNQNDKAANAGEKYAKHYIKNINKYQNKSVNEVLEAKRQIEQEREYYRQAYSNINHDFHKYANENIANNQLKKMHTGRKYPSLGQFKKKGNYEYQERMNKIKTYLNQREKRKSVIEITQNQHKQGEHNDESRARFNKRFRDAEHDTSRRDERNVEVLRNTVKTDSARDSERLSCNVRQATQHHTKAVSNFAKLREYVSKVRERIENIKSAILNKIQQYRKVENMQEQNIYEQAKQKAQAEREKIEKMNKELDKQQDKSSNEKTIIEQAKQKAQAEREKMQEKNKQNQKQRRR